MKTLMFLSMALLSVALTAGCKGKTADPADPTLNITTTNTSEILQSAKYFNGGWFSPAPNWSHDMTIDFTQFAGQKYKITAKHADPLCFKAGGLSVEDARKLIDIYSRMTLLPSTGPVLADAGVEYVEIKTSSGAIRKYHLRNTEVPAGEIYVTNPQEMSDFLKSIEAGLATACQ